MNLSKFPDVEVILDRGISNTEAFGTLTVGEHGSDGNLVEIPMVISRGR